MNFESPSQCKGNVTSYRYCFYDSVDGYFFVSDSDSDSGSDSDSDSDSDAATYRAKLMVYRRSTPTSNIYTPVPGSITTLSLSQRDADRFRCLNEVVSTHFEIQENDVVGACIMRGDSINPLYLIGNNTANYKLYQLDRSDYDDCTSSQIGSVDTAHEDFMQRRDFIMHLYANIGMLSSYTV